MKRESLKMQEGDWEKLSHIAAATRSLYSGAPSWRRLMLRIARGECVVKEVKKTKQPATD